jgi:hypothetical protein
VFSGFLYSQPHITYPPFGNSEFTIGKYYAKDSLTIQLFEPNTEIVYRGKPNDYWFSLHGYYFAIEELIPGSKDSITIHIYDYHGNLLTTFKADRIYADEFSDSREYYLLDDDRTVIRFHGASGAIYITQPPYTETRILMVQDLEGRYSEDPLRSVMNEKGTLFFTWGYDHSGDKELLFPKGSGVICYTSQGEFQWKYECENLITGDEVAHITDIYVSSSGKYCVLDCSFYESRYSNNFTLGVVVLENGKYLYRIGDDTMISKAVIDETNDILELYINSSTREEFRAKLVFLQLSTGQIVKILPIDYFGY